MISVSHPTTNANVKAVIESFSSNNYLHKYYTTVICMKGDFLYYLGGFLPDIRRRMLNFNLKGKVEIYLFYEIFRHIASKLKIKKWVEHEVGIFSIDNVINTLDSYVSKKIIRKNIKSVYAYEDCARETFISAKEKGINCFYDLPIGHWRAAHEIFNEQLMQFPDWAETMPGLSDSKIKLQKKDDELLLADHIFVASTFTAESLKKFPHELAPISIIPYGFPEVKEIKKYRKFNGKLKLLFVGSLTQRKGIAQLFETIKPFGDSVELTIIGNKVTDNCKPLNKELKKHKWIPSLPHRKILECMNEADVFIFPSLFEGFGLVITEAMAMGTPVISTSNTICPDIISNGINGWYNEAGNIYKMSETIESILENPYLIEYNGVNAYNTAVSNSWDIYKQKHFERVVNFSKNDVEIIGKA